MRKRPDYGIDSPAIVVGELVLGAGACGAAALCFALDLPRPLWIVSVIVGAFFLLNAGSMLLYSKVGKLAIRDNLLRQVPWRGDEMVLDVGCGRGLLLIGAARHLTSGKAVGVDRWIRGALSDNRAEAVLRNAALAGVAARVETREGDARHLPFADDAFDVVVSNFVVHEMDTKADREQMLSEVVRVLKPGGRVALVDFIFTDEALRVLRSRGVNDARRAPIGGLNYWLGAIATLGVARLHQVTGSKGSAPER